MDLTEDLIKYSQSGVYPMHMPGHKRNPAFFPAVNPMLIDITEIDGFDNLHNPQGLIKDEMKRIAKIYKSRASFISVNGSTAAILSAIYASTKKGDKIIMARNCHISVYHAVEFCGLKAEYIYPETDCNTGICSSITPEQVEIAVKNNNDVSLIVLTSPTYEGVVSDIKKISDIAHNNKIALLVDEAHGAHFIFDESFPDCAVSLGADMTVQSFHKTLPCFTGSACIHVNGNIVDEQKISHAMDIFETSSPSYIMLAGISHFMNIPEKEKNGLFNAYVKRLSAFSEKCRQLKNLSVLCFGNDNKEKHGEIFDFDMSKIIVSTAFCNIDGMQLYDTLLNEYKIQCEMSSLQYVVCMTSVADTDEGFDRLFSALFEIDKKLSLSDTDDLELLFPKNKQAMTISDALKNKSSYLPIEKSENKVFADYIYAYPPGIPIAVPGEAVGSDFLSALKLYQNANIKLYASDKRITDKLPCIDVDNTKEML